MRRIQSSSPSNPFSLSFSTFCGSDYGARFGNRRNAIRLGGRHSTSSNRVCKFCQRSNSLVGSLVSGSVSLIVLILVLIVAWNYIKLLFEAAERYILVGVLIYTAPVAFATGASENTSNVFSAWCRMLGGQLFLLIMNAWCLRLFTSMVGSFLANPLSV